MNPESQSYAVLGMTRSKAKMFEYGVSEPFHLQLSKDPSQLLTLCIGIIGDYGKEIVSEENGLTPENRENLLFAAQFFDSIIGSKLHAEFENYFLLVGSAAYYLVDLPGSASVLAKQISNNYNFEAGGIDLLLIWLLRNDPSVTVDFGDFLFSESSQQIYNDLKQFLQGIDNESVFNEHLNSMCSYIYDEGTDRQLLFADLIRSICKKRLYNSTRNSLQRYSTIDINKWEDIMLKPSFIKEFWPAQKLLGLRGIFDGQSGIIQMPTSSGKTKSIELIIRSSFLSERSDLAVIIAPFRALCSEIKNSLQTAFKFEGVMVDDPTDAMQPDFAYDDISDPEALKRVLILTPEKFIYILRTMPEISDTIGLLIYDEGHQFDNGIRGVTYELLLSSLKNKVPITAQVVLISAVISNAKAIGDWLIDKDKEIIVDKNLLPTYRTIAFATWTKTLGQLKFVNNSDPDEDEYYVPRVLESRILDKKPRERTVKNFPEKDDANDISLFLGLKLVSNGSVAIFCGSKVTVRSLCTRILDIAKRNYDVTNPLENSDQEEINKLYFLHEKHFGPANIFSACSKVGIFSHSANTPEGLRLAIENALQLSKVKFVICTSTLAQGVNLPIRYLLIASFYQAGSKIKNRDFHNLIGRAGRAGMYTEGSIIFTDPTLYDQKDSFKNNYKWRLAKSLLDSGNREPCGSALLTIFDPLDSDDKKFQIDISPLEVVRRYINTPDELVKLPLEFVAQHPKHNFSVANLTFQINYKIQIIAALESYIMAYWNDYLISDVIENVDDITTATLAYTLANEEQKQQLITLFRTLATNIESKTTQVKRKSYGRTLLGLQQLQKIEEWTLNNIEELSEQTSAFDLLKCVWPLIYQMSDAQLKKITPETSAELLSQQWISGKSYIEILESLNSTKTKIIWGARFRNLDQEFIIDACHSNFSYGLTLIITAICEVISVNASQEYDDLITSLYEIQKNIKYGLPDQLSIAFYELGFADRVIAIELGAAFSDFSIGRAELISDIVFAENEIRAILSKYPSYFESILDEFI